MLLGYNLKKELKLKKKSIIFSFGVIYGFSQQNDQMYKISYVQV